MAVSGSAGQSQREQDGAVSAARPGSGDELAVLPLGTQPDITSEDEGSTAHRDGERVGDQLCCMLAKAYSSVHV